jgi:phosphoribosylaminoimidazole-succinocarboxamide synthase
VTAVRRGKVRDQYDFIAADGAQRVALVTTDRQSAFDRVLTAIPFKGAALNLTSAWWFRATESIIPNHVVDVPHPNVTVAIRCKPFPVEFVVRGYITGSTSTSLWKNYAAGVRNYCGIDFPDGLVKNQRLARNVLTPTTKDDAGDRPISPADVVKEGLMTQHEWDTCAKAALLLFEFGQTVADEHGLVLVDTKYEFGRDENGIIRVIDEVHTPDSSRYWLATSYASRIAKGEEPENIDKEFLRLWFRDNCDPYKDANLPDAPADLVDELSRRYIMLYEMITGESFDVSASAVGPEAIAAAMAPHVASTTKKERTSAVLAD